MDPRPDQQAMIDGFLKSGKKGLWVSGPRKSGSSSAVMRLATNEANFVGQSLIRKSAAWVDRSTRSLWKLERLVGADGRDHQLWAEACAAEDKLERFWSADVVWIDDLYPELDKDFVRKNILLRADQSMKRGAFVLVSGNVLPGGFNSDWEIAIKHDYYTHVL